MTKQELMENYTMEQLADKIIALEITISDMKNTEKIIKQYNSKQQDCENIGVIIKCPDCGKENKFDLDENSEKLIRNGLTDKIHILEDENNWLKDEVHKQKNIINLIDDILENLFGVRHDVGKPNEFEQILKEKIYGNITIKDFLPEEPIKVADILINANYERNKGELEKKIHKAFGNNSDTVIENIYSISELRQIAEHLLVYCNANGEESE